MCVLLECTIIMCVALQSFVSSSANKGPGEDLNNNTIHLNRVSYSWKIVTRPFIYAKGDLLDLRDELP